MAVRLAGHTAEPRNPQCPQWQLLQTLGTESLKPASAPAQRTAQQPKQEQHLHIQQCVCLHRGRLQRSQAAPCLPSRGALHVPSAAPRLRRLDPAVRFPRPATPSSSSLGAREWARGPPPRATAVIPAPSPVTAPPNATRPRQRARPPDHQHPPSDNLLHCSVYSRCRHGDLRAVALPWGLVQFGCAAAAGSS